MSLSGGKTRKRTERGLSARDICTAADMANFQIRENLQIKTANAKNEPLVELPALWVLLRLLWIRTSQMGNGKSDTVREEWIITMGL